MREFCNAVFEILDDEESDFIDPVLRVESFHEKGIVRISLQGHSALSTRRCAVEFPLRFIEDVHTALEEIATA